MCEAAACTDSIAAQPHAPTRSPTAPQSYLTSPQTSGTMYQKHSLHPCRLEELSSVAHLHMCANNLRTRPWVHQIRQYRRPEGLSRRKLQHTLLRHRQNRFEGQGRPGACATDSASSKARCWKKGPKSPLQHQYLAEGVLARYKLSVPASCSAATRYSVVSSPWLDVPVNFVFWGQHGHIRKVPKSCLSSMVHSQYEPD